MKSLRLSVFFILAFIMNSSMSFMCSDTCHDQDQSKIGTDCCHDKNNGNENKTEKKHNCKQCFNCSGNYIHYHQVNIELLPYHEDIIHIFYFNNISLKKFVKIELRPPIS